MTRNRLWMYVAALSVVSSTLAAGAYAQTTYGQVSPKDFGAVGDCVHDDSTAIVSAAANAVMTNRALWTGDGCYGFGTKFFPPANLVWRGDFSEEHRMKWLGSVTGEEIEVNNTAIDVDGVVLDANRVAGQDRTSTTITQVAVPFAVHGVMTQGSPAYLQGVVIGRLKVENGQQNWGIVFANVQGMRARLLQVENNWGAGIMFAGVADSSIDVVYTNNVGSMGPETGRYGQSIGLFAEADAGKPTASWLTLYGSGTNTVPCLNFEPTNNVAFSNIITRGNTDTDVYIHDYTGGRPASCSATPSLEGTGIGVGNIRIGEIDADYEGKDLLKIRNYASDVHVGTILGRHLGARAFATDTFASNVSVGWIDIDTVGYDVVAYLLGNPQGTNAYTGGTNDGKGQTLSTTAYGIDMEAGSSEITIGGGRIKNIPMYLPTSTTPPPSEGYCLIVEGTTDVKVNLMCDTLASEGVRLAGLNHFDINVTVKDACRAVAAATCYGVFLTNDTPMTPQTGDVTNGHLTYNVWESTGATGMSAIMGYAFRYNSPNGQAKNVDIQGSARPVDFAKGGFGGVTVLIPTGADTINVTHNPIDTVSGSYTATTSPTGTLYFPHGAYLPPLVDSLRIVDSGGVGYRVEETSVDMTNIYVKVYTASGGELVSTSVTVLWVAHVANANGY